MGKKEIEMDRVEVGGLVSDPLVPDTLVIYIPTLPTTHKSIIRDRVYEICTAKAKQGMRVVWATLTINQVEDPAELDRFLLDSTGLILYKAEVQGYRQS